MAYVIFFVYISLIRMIKQNFDTKSTHFTNSRFEVNKKFHRCDIVHSIPIYM